jgi:hypothetical protein
LSAEWEELPPAGVGIEARANRKREIWLPGLLLFGGGLLTLLWIGFLGWLAYYLLLG